jgi:nucleotide-binding universal stress UspA family protein
LTHVARAHVELATLRVWEDVYETHYKTIVVHLTDERRAERLLAVRHGVRCTAAETRGSDQAAGLELLNQVTDCGATLLVMGGYGHRRLREFVFGGATRDVLRHMTVPVLMSH